MKKTWAFLGLLLISFVAYAALDWEIPNNVMKMGDGTNTTAKSFEMKMGLGASNPILSSTDGAEMNVNIPFRVQDNLNVEGAIDSSANAFTFGDATTADNKMTIDVGLGASNPQIGWSNTLSALVFDNGTGEKKFGTGSGGGGDGGENLLANPSFEDVGTPILNWTASGGTFTQENYTNPTENNLKFARMVSVGASEYFESDLITIPSYIGPGCMADFIYREGDSAFDYQVLDVLNAVKASGSVNDSTIFGKAPALTFDCEEGDQFRLRIISTAAGTIDVDNAYLGSNKNFIQPTTPSYNVGYRRWTSGGNSVSASTTFVESSSASQVATNTGDVSAASGSRLGITIPTLKAGRYRIFIDGFLIQNTTATGGLAAEMTISSDDITIECGLVYSGGNVSGALSALDSSTATCIYEASTDLINKEFYLEQKTSGSGSSTIYVRNGSIMGIDRITTSDEAQVAFLPEQADFLITGNISGANVALGTGAISSYTGIESTALSMSLTEGSAEIPCSGTNPSTGTTCSVGSESVGVSFNAPRAGKYRSCFSFSHSYRGDGHTVFQIVQTGNADQVIVQEGGQRTGSGGNSAALAVYPNRLCGEFELSQGKNTLRVMREQTSPITINDLTADGIVSAGQRDIRFTVEMIGHNVSKPILVEPTIDRFEVKTLASSVTVTTANIASFSNLVVGKVYKVYIQADFQPAAVGGESWVEIIHNGAIEGRVSHNNHATTGDAGAVKSIAAEFTAASSTVQFDYYNTSGMNLRGDGTKERTYFRIEELNRTEEVTGQF